MKKEILICSIFRNRAKFVERWYKQISAIAEYYQEEYDFSVSAYENDSIDDTKQKVVSYEYEKFKKFYFTSETKNTIYYPSIANEDRVKNLAAARNRCLEADLLNLNKFDRIIFIEPDFKYTLDDAIKIISAEQIYNKKIDIISGISLTDNRFYDSWATRKTSLDVNTGNNQPYSGGLLPYWSTFNGFCNYNAEPFLKGIRFGWFNKRLNSYDCDTVVICESFRENNYNEIYLVTDAIFHHEN
jgi:hypothetical protein